MHNIKERDYLKMAKKEKKLRDEYAEVARPLYSYLFIERVKDNPGSEKERKRIFVATRPYEEILKEFDDFVEEGEKGRVFQQFLKSSKRW